MLGRPELENDECWWSGTENIEFWLETVESRSNIVILWLKRGMLIEGEWLLVATCNCLVGDV